MNKLVIGVIYTIIAQVITYLQLQGNAKWNLLERYPMIIYLSSIPLTYLYITSVKYFVEGFGGQVWPSRLLGFSIGMIVFTILTELFFKEPITIKTLVSLILASMIILIQIFWK